MKDLEIIEIVRNYLKKIENSYNKKYKIQNRLAFQKLIEYSYRGNIFTIKVKAISNLNLRKKTSFNLVIDKEELFDILYENDLINDEEYFLEKL